MAMQQLMPRSALRRLATSNFAFFPKSAAPMISPRSPLQICEQRWVGLRPITTAAALKKELTDFVGDKVGDFPSFDYRCYMKKTGNRVSAWHGIPLKPDGSKENDNIYSFLCEIPKNTRAKMEVAIDESLNPIKQDTKKGKLRDYPLDIYWNYGMMPQTWEDPGHATADVDNLLGDNDPLDVVEIGSKTLQSGTVHSVKALGIYAMIDGGELDWKVIAISVDDPLAEKLNDVQDIEKHMPGVLEEIRVWFRDYKIPDGKPANLFGLDDKCMDKSYTQGVIKKTHKLWRDLKDGSRKNDVGLAL